MRKNKDIRTTVKDEDLIFNEANELVFDDKSKSVETTGELEDKKISWNSLIVTIILAIMAVLSIAQTAQTANIYDKIKNQDFTGGGSSTGAGSLQNLPSQVGGC